jgi:hypothetical protein
MYTVDFPAGFSSLIHRHNAQVSVYVLEDRRDAGQGRKRTHARTRSEFL